MVLTVDAHQSLRLPQPHKGAEHVPLRQHHGGVGHVHFEGGEALVHHLPHLPGDILVPVVDGHVEAVVTGALPLRFPPPPGQTGGKGLPLVRRGEVDDRGGAPPEGGPAAGGEVVGGDGARHLQVKVGVRVDEPGKEQPPGAVHRLGVSGGEVFSHGGNPLPLQQHVQPRHAPAGDHAAASKQGFHSSPPPCFF